MVRLSPLVSARLPGVDQPRTESRCRTRLEGKTADRGASVVCRGGLGEFEECDAAAGGHIAAAHKPARTARDAAD
jgi:hypothetical protein